MALKTVFIAIAASSLCLAVNAATVSTTFTVNAEVQNDCAVTATNMQFGLYRITVSAPTDATSVITVRCTSATSYTIGLDGGGSANTSSRYMHANTEQLNYQLYNDANRTVTWGNSVPSGAINAVGNGINQQYTVYGRIAPSQNVGLGTYQDTITVTITY